MPLAVVTGALGYSGQAIAERLFAAGWDVRTLTNSPGRPNPFGSKLEIRPLDFRDADGLARAMDGSAAFFNTYWVRFNHRRFSHEQAVANTKVLFAACRRAGVGRIIHTSILNPQHGSPLTYYAGKAEVEDALRAAGIPHTILRPGVLFGRNDILINNIAWVLRHLPVFGVFGDGRSGIRPMHVDDFADLAVSSLHDTASRTVDAVGPERFEYIELVRELARILGVRRPVVRVPAMAGHAVAWAAGIALRDVVLTRDEIRALTSGLLGSDAPASGATPLTGWAAAHRDTLGIRYASELRRRTDLAYGYSGPGVGA